MSIEFGQDRNPSTKGLYVAYVNGDYPLAANRMLLLWSGEQWEYQLSDQQYRDTVYAWVGPLPYLEIT
jgi:hypothetical protein